MYERETVLRLVGLIYDAALKPDAWPVFLETLGGVIGGHAVNLGYVHATAPTMSVSAFARWDPAALRDYELYYGEHDPWKAAALRRGMFRQGEIGIGEDAVTKAELQRTEFYNDYSRKLGLTGGMGGVILSDGQTVALVNASSLPNHSFGTDDFALVKLLLPHLERALQMHQRLTRLETEKDATADALDQLPAAVILTGPKGQVALINAAASAIVGARDGLSVKHGTLTAGLSRENARLQQLVAQCAATTNGKGLRSGGAMAVSRGSGRKPLHLLVTPLRTANRFAPRGSAGAAIFISDAEQQIQTDDELLRQFYGLTPAEARLALLLASGVSFREATETLDITVNTGRGHLKNIFSKTETRTQSQLVRLVLALPAIRRRP
jgi:DNA-binding CsgD family transcriptional regulator/PAS domain-containing protein